jgi:hypothetical protein
MYPVANLPTGELVPVAVIAVDNHTTLVVPVGVALAAVLYNELANNPLMELTSESVLLMAYILAGKVALTQ